MWTWLPEDVLPLSALINLYHERREELSRGLFFLPTLNTSNTHIYEHTDKIPLRLASTHTAVRAHTVHAQPKYNPVHDMTYLHFEQKVKVYTFNRFLEATVTQSRTQLQRSWRQLGDRIKSRGFSHCAVICRTIVEGR